MCLLASVASGVALSQEPATQRNAGIKFVSRLQTSIIEPAALDYVTFRAAEIKAPVVYALSRDGDLHLFAFPHSIYRDLWSGMFSGTPSIFGKASPSAPIEADSQLRALQRLENVGDGSDLAILGDTLLLTKNGGLEVFSLADAYHPQHIASVSPPMPFSSRSIICAEDVLFVLGERAISSYDVSEPASPRSLSYFESDGVAVNGCFDGTLLYVAESTCGGNGRQGIATYHRTASHSLREVAFTATAQAPYHLFLDSKRNLLACLDSGNWFDFWTSSNIRVAGRAAVFQIQEDGGLNLLKELGSCGGRAATVIETGGNKRLLCNGTIFASPWTSLHREVSFLPYGSALDGFPYNGGSDGTYAVLATDSDVAVFRVGTSHGELLGRCFAVLLLQKAISMPL